MIRSMTGWGEAEVATEGGRVRAEIKTVNHRFLNLSLRLPSGHERHEPAIQGWLKPLLRRGHATVSVSFEREDDPKAGLPQVDLERAQHAHELYREIAHELKIIAEVDVATIARFPDVIRTPDTRTDRPMIPAETLEEVVVAAAGAVVRFREAEGATLLDDLEGRLAALDAALDTVEARAPERLVVERDRLRAKIGELMEDTQVDEERLAREIAWLAEKWDIAEETVRFRGHIALMRETLGGEADEAVGKKLSFIVQEMHREANTIGSKANDAEIGHAAVAMKEEIERLREQVENVE